jgi:sodium/proline symporter
MEFVFFTILFVIALIGLASAKLHKPTLKNYYLADQALSPFLSGLSAMATNNSGYMFIGLIGFTYLKGLSSIWLMLGWILGDFIITQIIFKKMIPVGHQSDKVTYASIIGDWCRNIHVTKFIAVLSFFFLIIYASAQFAASGKTLMVIMDWQFYSGILVGGIIVILYSLVGGIRASIWTDAAQSLVMIIAMGILACFAIVEMGGVSSVIKTWSALDGYLNFFDPTHSTPYALFSALSWIAAGIFVVAQPHIMIRFFAVKDKNALQKSRTYYYTGFIIFYGFAFLVGMLSRIYLGNINEFDPELALPTMAQMLFDPFLLGVIIAGIFAATMSTADSLIINCSGNISHDILGINTYSNFLVKLITLGVAISAILLALINDNSVFTLVVFAWTILGFLFTPIILMIYIGKKIQMLHLFISSGIGFSLFCWINYFNYYPDVYLGLFPFLFCTFYLFISLKKDNYKKEK